MSGKLEQNNVFKVAINTNSMESILETDVREKVPQIGAQSNGRTKCPFYGFEYFKEPHNILKDSKGNQCPLHTKSYSPCKMEMNQQQPDWESCPANSEATQSTIAGLLETARIFPREFYPQEDGIPLQEWVNYIMHGKEMDSQRDKEISGLRCLLDRFGVRP